MFSVCLKSWTGFHRIRRFSITWTEGFGYRVSVPNGSAICPLRTGCDPARAGGGVIQSGRCCDDPIEPRRSNPFTRMIGLARTGPGEYTEIERVEDVPERLE